MHQEDRSLLSKRHCTNDTSMKIQPIFSHNAKHRKKTEKLSASKKICISVMIWVCLFFSLSHTLLYTHSHTHTHMHTDTYISLSLTCLSFQSAFALLCSATCSHSSNQSLYLQRLRSRLSAGLLYVMHSCVLFSS